jgi:hypothetical protein
MTTNLLVTLVWTLATNSVLVGKVRHVDVPIQNHDPTMSYAVMHAVIHYDRVTLTYRHDLSSNLIASFSVMGTTQRVGILSVPVRSWHTEENTFETQDIWSGVSTPAMHTNNSAQPLTP